jgi:hypothetical protein
VTLECKVMEIVPWKASYREHRTIVARAGDGSRIGAPALDRDHDPVRVRCSVCTITSRQYLYSANCFVPTHFQAQLSLRVLVVTLRCAT